MKNFAITTSMVALIASASAAQAQTAPIQTQKPASEANPSSATAPESEGLADIIVTATHRATNLQNTALAVSVVSSEALAERGITTVTDITKLVPAVKIGQLSGSSVQVTIRGLGNAGGNAFADAGVGFNLDGVYLARTTGASGIFYDVSRVEVLKGPQGTLYGRNSTGGVLNVVTNDPGRTLGVDLTGEYGNANHVRFTGAVNVPLSDTLAFRVAGQIVKSDGFSADGAGAEDSKAVRGKLKFSPSPALTILLQADYTLSKDGPNIGGYAYPGFNLFSGLGCGPTSLQNRLNPAVVINQVPPISCDSFNNNSQLGFSGTVNYDFGPATATLIVANRRTEVNYLHYGAGFPVLDDNRGDPSKYTTVEFRLASKASGPLKLQAGVFYFNEVNNSFLSFNQGTIYSYSRSKFGTKSIAGFGEATYSLTNALRLTIGGRYTSDNKTDFGSATSPIGSNGVIPGTTALPPGPTNPLGGVVFANCTSAGGTYTPGTTVGPENSSFTFPNGTCTIPVSGRQTFSKFTWKAGVEFDVSAHSLAYAQVTTGFRSGGFDGFPDGAVIRNFYLPETVTAYTVGIKNRFLNNKMTLNFEGFYYDYKNKQFSHLGAANPPGSFNNLVDNAGSATLYGVEVELAYKPTPHDILSLDVQYEHTKYNNFVYTGQYANRGNSATAPTTACAFSGIAVVPNSPFNTARIDCSGKPLTYSPEWVVNAGYRHTFDLGGAGSIVAGANTQIQSGYFTIEDYIPGEYQGSSTNTDANLTWTPANGHFSVTGYVNNIENSQIVGAAFSASGGPRLGLRPPRTYGARLNVTF